MNKRPKQSFIAQKGDFKVNATLEPLSPETKDSDLSNVERTPPQDLVEKQQQVCQALANIAFADIRHYLNWSDAGVQIKPSTEISEAQAKAISEISETINKDGSRSVKLKLYDKQTALTQLGKHLGMFVEQHEHRSQDGSLITPIFNVTIRTQND
ncbi:terminase small subunit [Magnetococcales bacterium HHB-1]